MHGYGYATCDGFAQKPSQEIVLRTVIAEREARQLIVQ